MLLFFSAALSGRAQVYESATKGSFKVYAGGEGSMFQPDYAGQGIAQKSPQRLYGIGAYVDADFTRWIQIEAEGRWLHWNQYAGISENAYLIGPRVPILVDYKRLTPYGKFLIGMYLGSSSATTSLGAAGALLGILFWVYYCAQIFLFGAAFTCARAAIRSRPVV